MGPLFCFLCLKGTTLKGKYYSQVHAFLSDKITFEMPGPTAQWIPHQTTGVMSSYPSSNV